MYDDNDYVTREELRARDSETASAVWVVGFVLLCILAPAAVMTGFWWVLGIGLVVLFFKFSGFRTFTLFALGGLCVWWGSGDGKVFGYWVLGAGVLNSIIAQYRLHKWEFLNWWEN